MQTTRLFAYQRPSRVQTLLESLVLSRGTLPAQVRKVIDRSELPAVLQRVAIQSQKGDGVWNAWADLEHYWFFTAEMSPSLSRERGLPVLQVGVYADDGKIRDRRTWVCLKDGTWHQCTQ